MSDAVARMPAVARWAIGVAAFFAVLRVIWPAPPGVILQGCIVGALTALIAFGLSLTYGANRIINFAQADLGVVPAVVMVTLVMSRGWSWWPALVVAMALAVLAGALVERFVIRPFADAPRLILSVATIGLAQVLAGIGTAVPFALGAPALGQTLRSPFDLTFTFGKVVFHGTDVLVFVAVPLAIVALVWFLRRSRWGMAIRAVAESRDRASLLGIDVARTQTIVWVITSVLATAAMILRAGIYGLPVGSAFGPSILLRALAVAVIGRMTDLRTMFVAATAFGVVEASILWNEDSAVLIDPAIFVIVLGFLLLQRRDRESRVDDQAVSSWRSSGLVRELPREVLALPVVRAARRALIGVACALAAIAPLVLSDSKVNLASALLVFGIIAVSLVVLTGWGGEISLGQMAFVAIGAAAAAAINTHLRWDMSVTLLVAGLIGAAAAVLIGLPALRIRGLFLAVTTLAFALATSSYLLNRSYFSFLPDNVTERVERLPLFGRTDVSSERAFYYVCLGALLVVLWAVRGLQHSRMRRVLIATRDNERTAQSFGISLVRVRLTAFAISGFIAAFAGALYTFQQQALGQQVFQPVESLRVLTMAVIGGLGSVPGALFGALYLKSTEWFTSWVPDRYAPLFSFAGTGVGLLVVLRFLPGGLSRPLYAARDRVLRAVARRHELVLPALGAATATAAVPPGRRFAAWLRTLRPKRPPARRVVLPSAGPADIEVRGLDVSYGPVQVLFGVDVSIPAGSIVALLGTNGAGKSTLLRAISGLTPPSAGSIEIAGVDVTRGAPHAIARAGVVQVPGGRGVFPSLTVRENLVLATWAAGDEADDEDHAPAPMEPVLELFPALRDRLDVAAASLSGGQQQMLTLGMAFLARPRVLMIDELSLGLAPAIVEQLLGVVRTINERGTTVVIVEQSVNVALTIADTAYFMEKGEIRFHGSTAELLARPDVLRAVYLHGAAAIAGNGSGGASRRRPATSRSPAAVGDGSRATVLEVRNVTKAFAGRVVLDDVTFAVGHGEVLGVIGPNGAGKTTLFDVISGFLAPDAGSVEVHGTPLPDGRPDRRRAVGVGRSFQDARLFGDLTVMDVLRVALDHQLAVKDPIAAAIGLADVLDAEADLTERADALLDRFAIGGFRDKHVSELSTGSRRIVDVACQLALGAPILLFDEPSSGIAQREAEALGPVLRSLRDELDASMLLIEHDMPLLTSVADRLVALDLGRVVCTGTVTDVLAHPQVVASYLGSTREVIERSGAAKRGEEATWRTVDA